MIGLDIDFNKYNTILMSDDSEFDDEGDVATVQRKKTQRPSRYKVLIHNDDYTTMEFVIDILENIFHKTIEEAQAIMLKVHMEGSGVCGIYTYEIAETKMNKVSSQAKDEGHPLKCTIEKE